MHGNGCVHKPLDSQVGPSRKLGLGVNFIVEIAGHVMGCEYCDGNRQGDDSALLRGP